jgi:ribose transport system ATP-binding protein
MLKSSVQDQSDPQLQLRSISRSFGATRALHRVDFRVNQGEVHALIGENGAGKSTLMKILSGVLKPDSGEIWFSGALCVMESPSAALKRGIAMIYQELTLAPHLSVEANITLGMEKRIWGWMRSRRSEVREVLALLGHPDLPLDVPVGSLPIGLQQVVEIARALASRARLIIMDEPTSSLSGPDTQALFSVIKELKRTGITVVYISHFLEEVMEIADHFTVLRDGEVAGTGRMADTSIPRLIRLMVGRELKEMYPRTRQTPGKEMLQVKALMGDPLPGRVDLDLRRGEIMGIAGLVGCGRSETLRSLFGLDRAGGGRMRTGDEDYTELKSMRPWRAMQKNLDLLSENRKEEGLVLNMPVTANITLSSLKRFASWSGFGLVSLREERRRADHWIRELDIRCAGAYQPVESLSGGNQQKVALARMLQLDNDILLLDEPTRGVDVGSKVEIYRWMDRLASQGKAILFVSSYLPELLGVCDTLAVMHRGRISSKRKVDEWTEEEILRLATSGTCSDLKDTTL